MRHAISFPFLIFMLSACAASQQKTFSTLDESTGVTITRAATPMLLYRDNAAYAAHARNYLQVGPIEVNKSGQYTYYLWLGVWSTVQIVDPSADRDGFETIIVVADGEPLSLDLSGWTPAAIGASSDVYLRPVSSAADAYFQVTADQVRMITNARDIRVMSTGNYPKEYQLWDKQKNARVSFEAFLKAAFF